MRTFLRIITTIANRYFPEQAHRFAPLAPTHLKLTPKQAEALECKGVRRIQVEFRPNMGSVIQRNFWTNGQERDTFLAPELWDLPRDVLLLAQSGTGGFEVRAGESYWAMSAARFEEILDHLIARSGRNKLNGQPFIVAPA